MKAIDTNILARFFINDPDDAQAAPQKALAQGIMAHAVFVPLTVVLEFEWVMRGFYELPSADIHRVFLALCGLTNVTLQDRNHVLDALSAYEQGLDFADALHLTHAKHCQAFVSFDAKLQKRAQRAGLTTPVETPK